MSLSNPNNTPTPNNAQTPKTTLAPNNTPAIIVAAIFVLGFLLCGIFLIVDAKTQYQKSIDYTERTIKDTSHTQRLNFAPNFTVVKDGYAEALMYFSLALGVIVLVLLLPRLQGINIGTGGINLTLKDLPQTVAALTTQTNAIQAVSAGEGGIKRTAVPGIGSAPGIDAAPGIPRTPGDAAALFLQKAAESRIDTQNGKWGGKAEDNGKKLSARVTASALPGLFTVILTVEGTNPDDPVKGLVHFHLHHSFSNPDPIIFAQNNKAVLTLTRVYGAFTVGVETEQDHTRLELDLAKIADAPEDFK